MLEKERAPAGPDAIHREQLKRWFAELVESLPVDPLSSAGRAAEWDRLADRWLSYMPPAEPGAPSAEGQPSSDSGTLLVRVIGGKPVAGWFVDDKTGQPKQIGLAPRQD